MLLVCPSSKAIKTLKLRETMHPFYPTGVDHQIIENGVQYTRQNCAGAWTEPWGYLQDSDQWSAVLAKSQRF